MGASGARGRTLVAIARGSPATTAARARAGSIQIGSILLTLATTGIDL